MILAGYHVFYTLRFFTSLRKASWSFSDGEEKAKPPRVKMSLTLSYPESL